MSTTIAAPTRLIPGEYTIRPDPSGVWRVTGPDGRDPFPDGEFRDSIQAFWGLVSPAVEEHLIPLSVSKATDDHKVVLYDRESETEVKAKIPFDLVIFLHNFAIQLGITEEDAVRKAIKLLKIAADANRDGKRVAIIDDQEDYEQDITGIADGNDDR